MPTIFRQSKYFSVSGNQDVEHPSVIIFNQSKYVRQMPRNHSLVQTGRVTKTQNMSRVTHQFTVRLVIRYHHTYRPRIYMYDKEIEEDESY